MSSATWQSGTRRSQAQGGFSAIRCWRNPFRLCSKRCCRFGMPLFAPLAILCGAGFGPGCELPLMAADPPMGGFRALLEQHQRASLRAAAEYIDRNPQADDIDQAYAWAFESASANGLEGEVLALAEKFLARRDLDPASRQLAQSALCIGLARSGKLDDGIVQFGAYLTGARFQSPFRTLDLAGSLSAQARMAGHLGASREIYERVAATYPFNAQIGEIVEGRIARQGLIGKPAPALVANDVQGKPFDLAALGGQVVLIDFWATNCAPCLAEFPNLRQIYKEHGGRGFEIVGVSFDDGPATVETFQSRAKLPWRMVMNEAPQGKISERYATRTIPGLFLVDKQGNIAEVDVRGSDLRLVVEKLLK